MPKLIPPDLTQCQAMKPNGATFMTLGGIPALVRCTNKPCAIIKEKEPGKDGCQGSMTVCPDCLRVAFEQLGHYSFIIHTLE